MERPLLSALEGMVDPVLLADETGKLIYLNSVAAKWLCLESLPAGITLGQALVMQVEHPVSQHDLWDTVRRCNVWTARQTYQTTAGGRREGKIRVSQLPGPMGSSPLYMAQIHDLSEDFAELRSLAEQERSDLLLDLLGSTTVELVNSLAALRWAAGLEDEDMAALPVAFRQKMREMRVAARRLHDLFRDLEDHLPVPPKADGAATTLLRDAVKVEPAVRVLVVGAHMKQAARLVDDLRRADLYCLVRTVQNRQQVVRAAIAGEVDAVVVGEQFSSQQFRDLVKTLGQAAPKVAVFDPRGVETEVLIRGIRGALKERKRSQSANRAWRTIEEFALRDPLTGVLNRRALDRFGQLEFARAQRYHFPLAVAFYDLDNFKEVNDQLGHAEGDRALQLFASAVQAGIREMDIVGRLGGDEFVMLMPHTDPVGALATVQRLRESAETLIRERLPELTPRTGVSAGFASFPDEEVKTYEELLARADQALYRAKRHRKQAKL